MFGLRDVQALAKLQMEFIQAQMQAMSEQAKELSETATKVVRASNRPPRRVRWRAGICSEYAPDRFALAYNVIVVGPRQARTMDRGP